VPRPRSVSVVFAREKVILRSPNRASDSGKDQDTGPRSVNSSSESVTAVRGGTFDAWGQTWAVASLLKNRMERRSLQYTIT
jgi:hypothetical protein